MEMLGTWRGSCLAHGGEAGGEPLARASPPGPSLPPRSPSASCWPVFTQKDDLPLSHALGHYLAIQRGRATQSQAGPGGTGA